MILNRLNCLLYELVPVGAAALWEIPASRELQEVAGVSEALSAAATGRVSRVRAGYACAHSSYGRTANVKPTAGLQTSKPLQNVCQSSHRYLKVKKKMPSWIPNYVSGRVSMKFGKCLGENSPHLFAKYMWTVFNQHVIAGPCGENKLKIKFWHAELLQSFSPFEPAS